MKIIYFLSLFSIIEFLVSDTLFLSDYDYKTIESGERVYLNGLYNVDSYSIDYNKKLFVDDGVLRRVNDRLLIGNLRDDLLPGTIDTIIFSTKNRVEYLELKISPKYFDLNIDSINDNIYGKVVFIHNNRFIKNGIDSLFLLIESNDDFLPIKFYSSLDDSVEEGYEFSFIFKKPRKEADYSLSLVKFTGSLSDTFYFISGFTSFKIENFIQYPVLLDSRSKINTDEIFFHFNDIHFNFLKTFYRYNIPDDSFILENAKFFVYINFEGGELLKDTRFLSFLKGISQKVPVIVFTRNIYNFLSLKENQNVKDFFEMIFDIQLKDLSDSISQNLILDPMEGLDIEYFYDKNSNKFSSNIITDSLSLFFYLPRELNFDVILQLLDYGKVSKKERVFKNLSSIVDMENVKKEETSILFYDISGNFLVEVFFGTPYLNELKIDLEDVFKKNFKDKKGAYIFKIKRSNENIKTGVFFSF